jgi:iron(III) transport system ATP-binding protein
MPVRVGGQTFTVRCRADAPAAGRARLSVRPHDLAFVESGAGLPGRVARLVYQGGRYVADVTLDSPSGDDGPTVRVATGEPAPVAVGEAVRVAIRDGWLLPGP